MVYQVKDAELTVKKVQSLACFGQGMNDQYIEAQDNFDTKLGFIKLQ